MRGRHVHYDRPEDERKRSLGELASSAARLLSYLRPYWLLVVALLVINVLLIGLGLIHPLLSKFFLDEAVLGPQHGKTFEQSLHALLLIVGVALGAMLLRSGLNFVFSYHSHRLGQDIIYTLRNQLYGHLQTLSVKFFEGKPTGEIMSRVISDSGEVENLIVHTVQSLLTSILRLGGIAGFMFVTNARLAALATIPIPLVIGQILFFSPRFRSIFKGVRQKFADMSTFLQERVSGIRIVKSFSTEEQEAGRFRTTTRDYYDSFMRAVKNFSLFGPLMGSVSGLGMLLVMYFGGRMAIREPEEMSPGTVMAFIMYTGMFYAPIMELGRLFGQSLPRALAAADRVFEFLDEEDKLEVAPDPIRPEWLAGRIEFQNLSFKYDEQYVLKDINLTIEVGQTVALVGPSGVGKTTLADLVSRFYDPQVGSVLIDGVDARRYDPVVLRQHIGVVLQEPFLFNTTVRENIAYGVPGAEDDQVAEAASEAGAEEFIQELEEGYDTVVGERGVKLSVGQKQRISIARALIKNPAILVLDEATSSVDTPTERVIQEALERAARGRTTILIAHRLSTTTMADRIIVLQDGAVVEHGGHAELLEQKGVFAELWEMQMSALPSWPPDPDEDVTH